MEMDGPTRSIVEFVRSSDFSALSPSCVHGVVRNYVDTVGCAAAGFSGESSAIARQIAATTAGTPAASAFGIPNLPLVELAIFANAAATRYCDWNDGGLSAGHPSDMTSAIVAMAEATGASIQDLICAIYVAYEIISALGIDAPLRDKKWDQGFNISIGVAAGVGKILHLTDDQLANALAIAITPSIPLRVTRAGQLSHWKSVATGHSSVTAAFAARLAAAGMTGPPHVFDGVEGVWEKVTDPFELTHLGSAPGEPTVPERVAHKYFPSFMESQGPITMMLALRKEFSPDEVESITLKASHLAWHEGGGGQGDHDQKWNPTTKETADHSLPFLMAKALVDGPITISSFEPEMLTDPALRVLMEKIAVFEDKEFTARRKSHHEENATIEVKLTDGRSFHQESIYPRGHAQNPMTDGELSEKFDGSVVNVLAAAEHTELRDRLWNLPDEKDLDGITALFRKFGSPSG